MDELKVAMIALALLTTTSAVAAAKDFCIDGGAFDIVGKSFKLPGKDKCKPFHGYKPGTTTLLSGSACTKSDGTLTRFTLFGFTPGGPEHVAFSVALATGSANGAHCLTYGSCVPYSGVVTPCLPGQTAVP